MPSDTIGSASTTSAVSMKLPEFWSASPTVWFAHAEAQFHLRSITDQKTKFYYVVAALPESVALRITDLLQTPPADVDAYDGLKSRLLDTFSLSAYQRAEAILGYPMLGDERPSQLMDKLLGFLPSEEKPNFLFIHAFLRRLPAEVRAPLMNDDWTDVRALAARADRIWVSHVSALQPAFSILSPTAVPSPANNPVEMCAVQRPSDFCWYHASVRTAFDRKEKGESAALIEEVMKYLESLESLWGDFESGLGVTARLWSMYIDMMLILRRYIHADRAGLWQQHLQEVRNMLPYTIASDHSKYMSCLPFYLNEMQKLPETAPKVHEEFAAGKFTVHQTAGDFNGMWTDLAMAFIQRFNTLGSSTFGQLQERYRDKLLNMKPRHCTEVHFVGDQYDFELKSLKCDERQRRESNINLPEYVPADSMKIPDWKTLLSNPCNRTNMLSYLASSWSQEASWPAGFCLVLGVNAQATRVTQTEHTDVDELYCPNHEEADTRIFAHIASCDDNKVFVIQATDTDIIFLAMYHFPRLPNVVKLWVEKNDLFLSIHDLVNELAKAVGKDVLALTDTLLISYILSGCDSVCYPFKRGKKRTVKVALEHVDKHSTLSNCIRHKSGTSAHDHKITEARSFFCDLYGNPGYLSLDKLRAHLFASRKLDLRSLPPTEDAFHFHVLRNLCQICLYKQASFSNPVLLPPEEYGRIVDGDRLIPVMKSKPSKPSAAKLKYCKCKKKPNCLRNCPCAKAAVPCIIACACNGDREKCGRLLTDH
ncbi:hypothetical protein GQR58_020488 [Nymphon striatum]|nr:hypothetical protein GQR58_020488 [Nymphon striatum]